MMKIYLKEGICIMNIIKDEIMNRIEINEAIFPKIMMLSLGKPMKDYNEETLLTSIDTKKSEIMIDLPRGAYLLYLQKIADEKNEKELRLLKQYAYGQPFSDADYEELLGIIMTSVSRAWAQNISSKDILSPFGISLETADDGNRKFVLLEDAVATIRVETWECIIIDMLKQSAMDIINCFDFGGSFIREGCNSANKEELIFSLSAWKFSGDIAEQRLSNALRSAFMFTLVSYHFGDMKNQYSSFQDFFDNEFYKRVSLVCGIWTTRKNAEAIDYIPLYDSFHNLDVLQKNDLIQILKAILDSDNIALDERQNLKHRLIDGAGEFHTNINSTSQALEDSLIKPAVNFILLREKAKDTLESAELLCQEGKYLDCADRCYYAMMFSLKALLEHEGRLAAWKPNELKERETHDSLENGLKDLVSSGILNINDEAAFEYVKDQRWKCDYSLYKFLRVDAQQCVHKANDFYNKIEQITV